MQYRREVDGLRTIAVVPVILFHAGYTLFSGGFVGVDIFFVISGYLITSIVTAEIEQGKFSIINFYERRARRIMPMLFFILLLCSVYAWFVLLPSDMKSYMSSLVSVIFFYSNIHFYLESGYWDVTSELKPLLHTWSLAVEEQFYIFFPVFLYMVRKLKKSVPILLVGFFIVASLCLSQWASVHASRSNFYLLPTRFWELAIGAIIGMAAIKYPVAYAGILKNKLVNEIMAMAGLLMILFSVFFYTGYTPFPSVYALVPTVGTALIIVFCSGNTIVGKILGLPFMVQIGLISYSAYLWHQPLLAFAKYQSFPELSSTATLILVLLVFPLSYLSWKYIEGPFRNKTVYTKKKIFTYWALGSVVFLAMGFIGIQQNGFENRAIVKAQKILNYQPDNDVLKKLSLKPLVDLAKKSNYKYETTGSDFDNTAWFKGDENKYKMLVAGNSHGENIYNTLTFSKDITSKFEIARYGCQITDLKNFNSKFYTSPNYKACDVVVIGSKIKGAEASYPVLESIIKKLYNDGKEVILIRTVYSFNTFGNRTLADFMVQKEVADNPGMDAQAVHNLADLINKEFYAEVKEHKALDQEILEAKSFEKLKSEFKNLIILDRMDYMCDDNAKRCYVINDKLEKYLFDYGHNTIEGSKFYAERIDKLNWLKADQVYNTLKQKKEQAVTQKTTTE